MACSYCAGILIAGIEIMHMIKKGQLVWPKAEAASAASQFYSLACRSTVDSRRRSA